MATPFAAVFRRALDTACLMLVVGGPAGAAAVGTAPADTARVHEAPEVVVTASRYGEDVHLGQANITAAELKDRIGTDDIPLLLEDTPGLQAYSDAGNGIGYTYLNIRGFDQKRVGVMINGIPLNDPEDHQVYWVDVPDLASSLEDVQVQRGITNSLGATTAVGGTVNLLTRQPGREPSGNVALQGGSYDTWRREASYDTGLLGSNLGASLRWSDLSSDGYRRRTGVELWSLFGSVRWVGDSSSVTANVYTGHEITHQGWYAASDSALAVDRRANPQTYPNAIDDFRQPHYELHHTWRLSDGVTLVEAAYLIHGRGFYENLKDGVRAGDFGLDRSLGLDPDASVDLVRRLWVSKDQLGWVPHLEIRHHGGRTVVGGDAYTFRSDHWGDVLSVPGVAANLDARYHEYTGDKHEWSAFANTRLEVLPGLTVLGDLQVQHKDYAFMQKAVGDFRGAERNAYDVSYDWFNPKGGVHWQLPTRPFGGRTAAYFHVGVTRREPTDAEMFDTDRGGDDLGAVPLFHTGVPVDVNGDGTLDYVKWSDPYVKPEKAVDYEFGWSWRGGGLSWTLDGYWMDFRHEIVPYGAVNDDGNSIRGNAEHTWHRGVELGLAAHLGRRHLLKVAASRSWDEFASYTATFNPDTWAPGTFVYDGNPIPLFPRHLFSVILDSKFGGLDTRVRLRGVGRQYLDPTGLRERSIDPYATLDVSAGLDLGGTSGRLHGARLDVRVKNVLDEKYETTGYWYEGRWLIPAAGRNVLAGVRYEF